MIPYVLLQAETQAPFAGNASPLEIGYAVVVFVAFALLAYQATKKAKPRRHIRPPQP